MTINWRNPFLAWLAGMSADNVLGWEIALKISYLLSKLRFSAIFIFRTISQPRTLWADIPAAWRGLFTKCSLRFLLNSTIFGASATNARLIRGLFSNANEIYLFLVMFPHMSLSCKLQWAKKSWFRFPSVLETFYPTPFPAKGDKIK